MITGDYLRQDDWNAALWNGHTISDHVEFVNATFEMFRPVSMFVFYLTDMISLNIEYAKYVRLINVLFIGFIGIGLYVWAKKFNKDKILNLCFSISACTLPAFQIYAATANYCFMIVTVLMSVLSVHLLYMWYFNDARPRKYFFLGCCFFFLALMNYTLAAMFVWVMLMILFVNSEKKLSNPNIQFLLKISLIFALLMVAYFLTAKFVHWFFSIQISRPDRAVMISFNPMQKIEYIFQILTLHSKLWLMRSANVILIVPIIWLFLFVLTLCLKAKNSEKRISVYLKILFSALITGVLFVLSFSPALAPSGGGLNFRYTVSTMPFILYIVFWSFSCISASFSQEKGARFFKLADIKNGLLVCITFFAMVLSNLSVSELIVGPQRHELNFLRQKIYNNVVPALKQNKKVAIEVIVDDPKSYVKPGFQGFEYGTTSSGFRGMFIGSIVYLMREIGFETNTKKIVPKWGEKQILLDELPWGALFIHDYSVDSNKYVSSDWKEGYKSVTIDMRNIGPYR